MDVSDVEKRSPHDPARADCPGRDIFETVTNRWTFLILWCLRTGPLRFFELRDTVEGISERVLSENLKKLARDGLVERHVEPTRPPKVSYTLTPIGEELTNVVQQLANWIDQRTPDIERARLRHDAN
ncbi:MAG: helix-turn-helix transcriptional regulator [Hyphomonas sp.]|nr:helix-turn-helix transcriptional regulator [Hyphomonas sp.]